VTPIVITVLDIGMLHLVSISPPSNFNSFLCAMFAFSAIKKGLFSERVFHAVCKLRLTNLIDFLIKKTKKVHNSQKIDCLNYGNFGEKINKIWKQ